MKLLEQIKALYTPPSATVIAARELEEHKRRLLQAQAAAEYAYSMTSYHQAVIARLTAYLHKATEVQDV